MSLSARPALGLLLLLGLSCQFQSLSDRPPDGSGAQFQALPLPSLTFSGLQESLSGEDSGVVRGQVEVRAAEAGTGTPTGPVLESFTAALRIRGQSSASPLMLKKSFALELRDPRSPLSPFNASLVGLPPENDFVLHASYSDKSLLRNYTAYTLSNAVGLWAPRVRLVELWGSQLDGDLSTRYQGIYVLTEKIKVDKHRVALTPLTRSDNAGEALTGGYLLKIDKMGPTEWYPSGLRTSLLSVVDPNAADITSAQQDYITQYLTDLEAAADPDSPGNWRAYIDESSFAQYFLLQELYRNIDSFRISTFMHKDRGGKLKAGPLWDFDIAMGNDKEADWQFTPAAAGSTQRAASDNGVPDAWVDDPATAGVNEVKFGWILVNQLDPGWADSYAPAFWWKTLLRDAGFRELARSIWKSWRSGPLRDAALTEVLAKAATELSPGLERNYSRWDTLNFYVWPNVLPIPYVSTPYGSYTYQDHLRFLEEWLLHRAAWMDSDQAWNALNDYAEEP